MKTHDTCVNPVSRPGQHSASLSATDIQQARIVGGSEVSADDGEDERSHFGWSGGAPLALLLGSLVNACNAPSGTQVAPKVQIGASAGAASLFQKAPLRPSSLKISTTIGFRQLALLGDPPYARRGTCAIPVNWSGLGAELPR